MEFRGTVGVGKGYGRTLGFPTANIPLTDASASGIYAAVVRVDGEDFPAAVYADPSRSVLEAHTHELLHRCMLAPFTDEVLLSRPHWLTAPLIDQKVKFYAALGNHDDSNQRFYEYFNMEGQEYYHFNKGNVSFYSLNSNYMDKKQVDWFNEKLVTDTATWKIAFFHHPPYSSGGTHGSDTKLREIIEPIFLKNSVNVVFAGHEHFYERLKPQHGIYYFISGSGGKLRKGDVKQNSPLTAKAFDDDMSFVLIEVDDTQMYFQVVSRTGETVDSGVIVNQRKQNKS